MPENEKIVIKASGLAQGKGVFICENVREARMCVKEMMVSASLGSAGETIVIEEFLEGDEVSVSSFWHSNRLLRSSTLFLITIIYFQLDNVFENQILAFCDGTSFSLMPPAQDNKRLKNNDLGPNTGGMGAVCPYYLSTDDINFIKTEVFEKAVSGMQSRGHPFKGISN